MKQFVLNRRFASQAVFWIGVMGTLLLAAALVWADMEAALFDSLQSADGQLSSLSCPLAIGSQETGRVRASFTNEADSPVTRTVRVHISDKYISLLRGGNEDGGDTTYLRMAPRETQTLEWKVFPHDAVWGRVVMARVVLFRSYPQISRMGSCGILLIPLPVPGIIPLVAAMILSVGCMAGGWLWWKKVAPRPSERANRFGSIGLGLETSQSMLILLVSLLVTLIVSTFNVWVVAIVLLVISFFILLSLITTSIMGAR